MNKKKILILILSTLIIFSLISLKIDTKKDLIWHLKENLNPRIVVELKKRYIFFQHKVRKTITLKKLANDNPYYRDKIMSNKGKYSVVQFKSKLFLKNGPKVFIESFNEQLVFLTGTGILSYSNINNFKNDTITLNIIRNNLLDIFEINKVVENPVIVLNLLIHKDKIFLSYVNEKEKGCYNTAVLMGEMNLKKIIFKKIFNPSKCIKKINEYGEFYYLEAGGALEIFNDDQLLLSTGTFRYRDLAQEEDNVFGKILLIDFKKNEKKILSMGHRNVQGIFFDKKTNTIFSTDHGPEGGDEINIIVDPLNNKIKNFGWPISSYGEHYGGRVEKNIEKYKKAPLHKSHIDYGFIEPLTYFVPSIAPSNIIFVPQEFNKNNKNQIFVSAMGLKSGPGRRSIHSFFFDQKQKLTSHEIIPLGDRVRDILYDKQFNSLFLTLEKSGSIAILKTEKK